MSIIARKNLALAQYRLRARFYDQELAAFEPIRTRAIACLNLQPGDTVLDLGCGTGLSFEALIAQVGPRGHIVAVEQSADMAAVAHERIAQHGWGNTTLVQSSVEDMPTLPQAADAALFHFTHDILTSAAALENALRQLKPRARVVAAGLQWSSPWDWATNTLVLAAAMYSVTNLDALEQPWKLLTSYCDDIVREPSPINGTYIVHTRLHGAPPTGPRQTPSKLLSL